MNIRTRAPLAFAAASLLALSACESATESYTAPEGTVVFAYAGDASGSYNATGRYNRLRSDLGTFAVAGTGQVATGEDALAVFAHAERASDNNLADEFLLTFENPAVGTVTCDAEETSCPFSALFLLGATAGDDIEALYSSVSGTVTITSINEDRARGTFSFQMEDIENTEELLTVQVTNGTFDVPIIEGIR